MTELPAIGDIAYASTLVGALFLLRFLVTIWRIRRSAGHPRGFAFDGYRRATRPGAYGAELEPDRRHAARQLYVGLFFLGLGLLLSAGILAAGVFGPPPAPGSLAGTAAIALRRRVGLSRAA